MGSRSNTLGDLYDFGRVLERRSFCRAGTETCHNKHVQGAFWKKVGSRSNTWRDLSDFCRVLRRRSLCRSGPKACHKQIDQGTFKTKWGADPTPWGTYLIFVGSSKGGHFARRAPKHVTRNVSREHFGKSGKQAQHLAGLIRFLSGLKKEVTLQVGSQSLSQTN